MHIIVSLARLGAEFGSAPADINKSITTQLNIEPQFPIESKSLAGLELKSIFISSVGSNT